MLMMLIFASFIVSSFVFSDRFSSDGNDDDFDENEDQEEVDETSDLLDSLYDEAGSSDSEGLDTVFEGTPLNDQLSTIKDGIKSEVTLDRGLIETSDEWAATFEGFAGNDTIFAQGGHFLIYGGEDDDTLVTENASGLAFGGDGNDFITLSGNNFIAVGDGGQDTLFGADGSDTLIGGEGSDLLLGGEGDDLILGHGLWYTDPATGSFRIDSLLSNANDTLIGGGGNDTLMATGGDFVSAGGGTDVIHGYFFLGQEPVYIDAADEADSLVLEIVVQEDLYSNLEDSAIERRDEDGGVSVYFSGYPVIHFSENAAFLAFNLQVKISVYDADGNYMG